MTDEKPKPPASARPPAPAAPPPKLERVPAGYRPPPTARPPAAAPPVRAPPAATAPGAGAPSPPRPSPAVAGAGTPAAPPAPTYGLTAREVGADAALAAGLPLEGSLVEESALHLFALAAAVQATGRMDLTGEGGSFALTFRRGTVEHAASSDPADDLGRFLLKRGAVGAEALARAELSKGSRGGDLVSSLIAERLVNPGDVAALLQEHGTQLVQRALAVERGAWSWAPQAPPPPGAFPLGAPFAMLCAAVRGFDASALARRLGDREHRVASRMGGRIRLEDLRFTPQETRAAGLFDGVRSPAEIAAASLGDTLVVLRVALLLAEVELLSFGASRKGAAAAAAAAKVAAPAVEAAPASPAKPPAAAGDPKAAAARPAASARPAPPPAAKPAPPRPLPGGPAGGGGTAGAPSRTPAHPPARAPGGQAPAPALSREPLEALVAKLAGADHFAVLGVKQDAPAAQVKAAYFQLAKSYHPDAVPAGAPAEVRKLCADVFARVSEAWSVLGDEGSRAVYLEKLKSGALADVDVMNIFQAENAFQAGALLVKARKYDEGLRKFEEAMKLNPEEAEFGMWKAWCEFLLADDRKRKIAGAISAIEAGLKKNPRCAQGYLFLGQMCKLAGDLVLAERHLRRGLDVAPDHAELQRELKYLHK